MVSWVFRLSRKQNGNKFSHHGKFGVVSIVDVPFIQTLTKREIMVNCQVRPPNDSLVGLKDKPLNPINKAVGEV